MADTNFKRVHRPIYITTDSTEDEWFPYRDTNPIVLKYECTDGSVPINGTLYLPLNGYHGGDGYADFSAIVSSAMPSLPDGNYEYTLYRVRYSGSWGNLEIENIFTELATIQDVDDIFNDGGYSSF